MCIIEVKIKDIARIKNISYGRAFIHNKAIKQHFGKTDKQVITLQNVSDYYGIPIADLHQKLTEKPGK